MYDLRNIPDVEREGPSAAPPPTSSRWPAAEPTNSATKSATHQSHTTKVAAYEAAKLASDFDPQNRDENTDYYVAKLDELVKKFAGIPAAAPPAAEQQDFGL